MIFAGCASFNAPKRTLPPREDIVLDPAAHPNIGKQDLGVIAGRWRATALENENRLIFSGCNYEKLRAAYLGEKQPDCETPVK